MSILGHLGSALGFRLILRVALAILLASSLTLSVQNQPRAKEGFPLAAFTWEPCLLCMNVAGNVVFFNANWSASPSGSIASYTWDYGDGTPPVKTPDPWTSHVYFDLSGKWLVTLTVQDSSGLADTISQLVVFDTVPRFTFQPKNPTVGETVAFDASTSSFFFEGPAAIEFQWNFGDGATGSGVKVSHQYSLAGIYRVLLTLATLDGNPSISKTIAVSSPGLALKITTDKDVYLVGETVVVTVTLTNQGPRTFSVTLSDPCFLWFMITDSTGSIIYDSTLHYGCTQVIYTLTLVPGESVSVTFQWDQRDDHGTQVAPGVYDLLGFSEPPISLTASTPTAVKTEDVAGGSLKSLR